MHKNQVKCIPQPLHLKSMYIMDGTIAYSYEAVWNGQCM